MAAKTHQMAIVLLDTSVPAVVTPQVRVLLPLSQAYCLVNALLAIIAQREPLTQSRVQPALSQQAMALQLAIRVQPAITQIRSAKEVATPNAQMDSYAS